MAGYFGERYYLDVTYHQMKAISTSVPWVRHCYKARRKPPAVPVRTGAAGGPTGAGLGVSALAASSQPNLAALAAGRAGAPAGAPSRAGYLVRGASVRGIEIARPGGGAGSQGRRP